MRINGLNPGFAHDDDEFAPRTVAFDHASKAYIFCQADGAVSAGDVVIVSEAAQADRIDLTNAASAFGDRVGVAAADLANDEYDWIQVHGPAQINVKASAAANTVLNATSTGGRLDDDQGSGSEDIDGLVLTTARAATARLAAGFLHWPTVGATNP